LPPRAALAAPEAARRNEAAKTMLTNPEIGVTQIAHRLGVSTATLYRHILVTRTANGERPARK
jgi:hypothetical protein